MNNRERIKITCRNPKKFLKELINNKINLYDININKKNIEIIIDEEDLSKIDKIKYLHKIKIIKYYGPKKIMFLIKKNKFLIIFIIIGILINIILSNIIFNIEVETPNQKLKQIILKDLKDNNIAKYHLKVSDKKKKSTKEKILIKEHNKIEWIEIVEKGTKYIIKIQERKINSSEEKCYPRNIIAKKNATITKINSSSGEILKKENDFVTKNEVLISGLIYNKEKIVSKRCAIGKVYGEVWYTVKVKVPKKIKEEVITNNNSYGLSIKLLNKEININNKYKLFQKKQYNIISSRIIPIEFGFTNYKEKKVTYKNISSKDVDSYALKIATKKINKELSNPNIVNKKVLKKQVKNSKIIIDIFFAVEEDITTYQDISDLDIEKMNQERE